MRRGRAPGRGAVVVWLALLTGCQKSLPSAPSTGLTAGIVVFEHANFLGASAHVTDDIADLSDFKGPCLEVEVVGGGSGSPVSSSSKNVWNDCISSVQVAPGWTATLYRDRNYRDDALGVTEDMSNLQLADHNCPKGGLNDCVSSIRVRRQQ
jgi:hypothetical protein